MGDGCVRTVCPLPPTWWVVCTGQTLYSVHNKRAETQVPLGSILNFLQYFFPLWREKKPVPTACSPVTLKGSEKH